MRSRTNAGPPDALSFHGKLRSTADLHAPVLHCSSHPGGVPMRYGICLSPCLAALVRSLAARRREGRFMRYSRHPRLDHRLHLRRRPLDRPRIDGGTATRLTSHPGRRIRRTILSGRHHASPSQQATTAATAVYLMPASGGIPGTPHLYARRSTQPSAGRPTANESSSDPCSKTSSTETRTSIPSTLNGSLPERLPWTAGYAAASLRTATSILYSRKGSEEYYWKRYKGGQYQDIWRL